MSKLACQSEVFSKRSSPYTIAALKTSQRYAFRFSFASVLKSTTTCVIIANAIRSAIASSALRNILAILSGCQCRHSVRSLLDAAVGVSVSRTHFRKNFSTFDLPTSLSSPDRTGQGTGHVAPLSEPFSIQCLAFAKKDEKLSIYL